MDLDKVIKRCVRLLHRLCPKRVGSDVFRLVDEADVVSFDLFDTLVYRNLLHPTDVFSMIEGQEGAKDFARERRDAEIRAFGHCCQGVDVSLDAIYAEMVKYRQLEAIEEDTEVSVCRRNKSIGDIWKYALRSGKKIVVTSDMYLSSRVLARILQATGYSGYQKIYVSCEVGLRKSDGGLYDYIVRDQGLERPDRLLHIGDNLRSDYVEARMHGVRARHFVPALERWTAQFPFFGRYLETRVLTWQESRVWSCVVHGLMDHLNQKGTKAYWHYIGYVFGGVIAHSVCRWLHAKAQADGIDGLLFVARDGYSLKQAYACLYPQDETFYLYAPRMTSLLVTLDLGSQNMVVRERTTLIEAYKKRKRLKTQEELRMDSMRKRESYREYLSGLCDMTVKTYGIVDGFSESFSAQKLVESTNGHQLNGYYLSIPSGRGIDRHHQSYLTFAEPHFLELLFSAPEPPIEDVISGRPVYRTMTGEERQNVERYPAICEGLLACVRALADCAETLDGDSINALIADFVAHATRQDKRMFASVRHGVDIRHTVYKPIFDAWRRKNLKQYIVQCGIITIRRRYEADKIIRTLYLFGKIPLKSSFVNM